MKRFALLAGTLSLVLNTLAPHAFAQSQSVSGGEERLTIAVGDVFEIIADAGEPATSSWILTQDRSFIEAGRDRLFRYRFVQEKDYTLLADITLTGSGQRIQRTFRISVVAADDSTIPTGASAGTGANLTNVVPAADTNGRIILSPVQRTIKLTPTSTDYSPLALDLDAARDSDGDGNSENDVDNTETYFQSFGRSLWVWFARPITKTDLIVTAVPAGQSPLVQRVTVATEEAAREEGLLTSPVEISVEQINDSTFAFSPTLGRAVPTNLPLLYIWEFGDGLRSLETRPTHEFTVAGVYEVKLNVRDLQTGNTIGVNSTTVMPTGVATPEPDPTTDPDPADPTPTDPEPEPSDTETPTASATPWGRYALIGSLFIVSLLIGIAIVWLLSFLRRSRKLEQTLETMEKAIVPEAEKTPPPLSIKGKQSANAEADKQKVIDAEINAAAPAKVANPPVTDAVAPDWLKKGLAADQKKSAGTPPLAPTESKAQPSSPAPTTPKPVPPPPAAKPVTPAAPTPKQATAPKPQATVPAKTEKSPNTQAQQTPSASQQIPNDHLPHWLKPETQSGIQTPTASTPAPAAPSKAPTPATPLTPKPTPIVPKTTVSPSNAPNPPAPPVPPRPTVPPAPPMPKEALQQTPPAQKPATPAPPTPKPIVPPAPPAPKPNPVPPAPPMPVQVTPPVTPVASTPPTPPTPAPPLTEPKPVEQKKDDDPPIAFIRAENIDPGPAK